MLTNQMTHEASMAVSIIDNIEGKDVQSVAVAKNKIIISQKNRIIAQWTGETWILGSILQSVLPSYEDNCIHVINACTRLHRRAVSYVEKTTKETSASHSLRMIRHHMDTSNTNSMPFSGSVMGKWSPSVFYFLSRRQTNDEATTNKKESFQLYKGTKSNNVVSKVDYGFGTSLIGWITLADNRVVMASNFTAYLDKWSLNGTKEIVKDDVLRQIAEFNNTKKR